MKFILSLMRNTLFLLIILSAIINTSCQKKCDCSENWDSNLTYVKNDLVLYNDKCWEAIGQGRGIEPGPWLENGNDIWEECNE